MVEIAIAIGVIGFALVAIVGIIPRGLSVQKDNREDAIINQDGPYFLNAICNGQQGLDFLTNYVEQVRVDKVGSTPLTIIYSSNNVVPPDPPWNGATIIGFLSQPKYEVDPLDPNKVITNIVTARVRALSGAATMQNGNNSQVAFSYLLTVEALPFQYVQTNVFGHLNIPSDIAQFATYYNASQPLDSVSNLDYVTRSNRFAELSQLRSNLFEVRLKFQWPLFPGGTATGAGLHQFRAMVSGQPFATNGFKFFKTRQF